MEFSREEFFRKVKVQMKGSNKEVLKDLMMLQIEPLMLILDIEVDLSDYNTPPSVFEEVEEV